MRAGRLAGAGALAGVLLAGLPAAATARLDTYRLSLRSTGAFHIAWHGDPARGCQTAGVCDVSGLLTLPLTGTSEMELEREGGRWSNSGSEELEDTLTSQLVVRVRRGGADGPQATCLDLIPVEHLGLTIKPGRHRWVLVPEFASYQPSSGRCAGPTALDLFPSLPQASLGLRRMLRRPTRLDLSGERSFGAGPFTVDTLSSLRVTLGRLHHHRSSEEADPGDRRVVALPPRPVRFQVLSMRYRIERVDGSLTGTFAGMGEPSCRLLDACGLTGTWTYTLGGARGWLNLEALRSARRSRLSRPTLVRAVRAGRVPVTGVGEFDDRALGRTDLDERRDGALSCHDAARTDPPTLGTRRVRRGVKLGLGWGEGGPTLDVLRSRCPGPGQLEVLGDGDAATGVLPASALLRPRIDVRLTGHSRFSTRTYAGTGSGELTVHARLVETTFRNVAL